MLQNEDPSQSITLFNKKAHPRQCVAKNVPTYVSSSIPTSLCSEGKRLLDYYFWPIQLEAFVSTETLIKTFFHTKMKKSEPSYFDL